jgi:hypothetical protein
VVRWLYDYRWSLIGLLAATTFALGSVGFWIHLGAAGEPRTITQVMYLSLQLFVLDSGGVAPPTPVALDAARFMAPVVAFSAAIGALGAFFQEQFQMVRIRRSAGHVVVCGAGWRGSFIARRFHDAGWRVVVIEHDEGATGLAACRAVGIPVIAGDATDLANLTRARTSRARYLISVCGGDEDTLQVAVAARGLEPEDRGLRPHLLLHMSDQRLAALAQTAAGDAGDTRVESFNVYERGARAWVQEHPPFRRGGEGAGADPHLLLVGLGQMGRYVLAEVIRTWLATRSSDRRMRITVIDREADRKARDLELEYPALSRFAVLRALSMDAAGPEFRAGAFLDDDGSPSAVYLCMKDTTQSLTAALHLHERMRSPAVPIVIRTQEEAGLSRVLRWSAGVAEFESLRAFPVLEQACTPDVLLGSTALDLLAQEAHAAYTAFVRARETASGNPSVTEWDDLPEHLRESNRRQVMHIGAKLRAIGCAVAPAADGPSAPREVLARALGCPVIDVPPDEPEHALADEEVDRLARVEHDRWVAERLFEGWTYSPGPKDLARKTTPDLAPWEELSEEVRDLDRNVVRAIPTILARVGLRVVADPSAVAGSTAC